LPDFQVFETDEFLERLGKLSSKDADFIRRKLDSHAYPQIKREPFWGSNIKKLKGYDPDTWRYRIGNFRIFYVVDQADRTIYILTVENRKDAYK